MSNQRVEALPALGGWLRRQGISPEKAAANVESVRNFYSAYILGVFRKPVDVGISVRKSRKDLPNVIVHMIWPANLQEIAIRTEDIETYQQVFSSEVASPALPHASFGLEICSSAPQVDPAALISRLAREQHFRSLGLIGEVRSMRYFEEYTDILRRVFVLREESRSILQVAGQIHELTFGLGEKPETEQRAILKQARRILVAKSGKKITPKLV